MESPPLLDVQPHRFRPAHRGTFWPGVLRGVAEIVLRRAASVRSIRVQCADRLRVSLQADRPVLAASNSNKYFDPIVFSYLSGLLAPPFHYMAAVTDFEGDGGIDGRVMQLAGAFSVDRGVADRAALREAVTLLTDGRRPLVMFPESIARFDGRRIFPLVPGAAYIACASARERAAAGKPGPVIHPTLVAYRYRPGLTQHLAGHLDRLDRRMCLARAPGLSVSQRLLRIGLAALDRLERRRAPSDDGWATRVGRLLAGRLDSLEVELGLRDGPEHPLERIRRLHKAIAESPTDPPGRDDRTRRICSLELALRLLRHQPAGDTDCNSPDRAAEAVERLQDDLCGEFEAAAPMDVVVRFGEAIPVEASPRLRDKGDEAKLLHRLRDSMQAELDILVAQPAPQGRRVL